MRMNSDTASIGHAEAASGSPLALLLVVVFTCWCWLGGGPWSLRWIALIVLVLMSSGHPIGHLIGSHLAVVARPLLALVFVFLGFAIILRGFGWLPRRRWRHPRYGRRWWYDDRW